MKEEDFLKEVHLSLRHLLQEERVSITELAARLQVRREVASRFLREMQDIRLSTLSRICGKLGKRPRITFEEDITK